MKTAAPMATTRPEESFNAVRRAVAEREGLVHRPLFENELVVILTGFTTDPQAAVTVATAYLTKYPPGSLTWG